MHVRLPAVCVCSSSQLSVALSDHVCHMAQAASEAQGRLHGHEARMAELQKEVDSAQRLMRAAQLQARESVDEKSALTDKASPLDWTSQMSRLG